LVFYDHWRQFQIPKLAKRGVMADLLKPNELVAYVINIRCK